MPEVAFTPLFGLVSDAGLLPGVAAVPACGVVGVPVWAGCVLTALGLVVPLPSCEFAPVGLAGSAGVWLVTGVLAIDPFSGLWLFVLEGELVV